MVCVEQSATKLQLSKNASSTGKVLCVSASWEYICSGNALQVGIGTGLTRLSDVASQ